MMGKDGLIAINKSRFSKSWTNGLDLKDKPNHHHHKRNSFIPNLTFSKRDEVFKNLNRIPSKLNLETNTTELTNLNQLNTSTISLDNLLDQFPIPCHGKPSPLLLTPSEEFSDVVSAVSGYSDGSDDHSLFYSPISPSLPTDRSDSILNDLPSPELPTPTSSIISQPKSTGRRSHRSHPPQSSMDSFSDRFLSLQLRPRSWGFPKESNTSTTVTPSTSPSPPPPPTSAPPRSFRATLSRLRQSKLFRKKVTPTTSHSADTTTPDLYLPQPIPFYNHTDQPRHARHPSTLPTTWTRSS